MTSKRLPCLAFSALENQRVWEALITHWWKAKSPVWQQPEEHPRPLDFSAKGDAGTISGAL
jgi:hypothetical protein